MSAGVLAAFVASGLEAVPPQPPAVDVGPTLADEPVLIWSAQLPGTPPATATRSETAGPVAHGDYVFVGHTGANALLVLDRRDGSLKYELPARAAVAAAPVVTDEWVYFADSAGYTFAYKLSALADETPAWSHFSGAPIVATPTLHGDRLYIANVDDLVFALDPRTGALVWRHGHKVDVGREAELELFGAPPVVPDPEHGQLLVGFSDGFLVALGLQDGAPRWQAEIGEGAYPDIIAPPTVGPTGILVGGYSEPLVSLDFTGRTVQWRLPVGSASAFTLKGDALFHGGTDGALRRVDARSGDVAWVWQSGVDGGTMGRPVPTPQGLLVANSEDTIYLIDERTGSEKWRFDPGWLLNGVAAPLSVDGDTVYAVSNAGTVYAFRGRAEPPEREAPPWVAEGR